MEWDGRKKNRDRQMGSTAPRKPRGGCSQFRGFWDVTDAGGSGGVELLGLSSCCFPEDPFGSGIFRHCLSAAGEFLFDGKRDFSIPNPLLVSRWGVKGWRAIPRRRNFGCWWVKNGTCPTRVPSHPGNSRCPGLIPQQGSRKRREFCTSDLLR